MVRLLQMVKSVAVSYKQNLGQPNTCIKILVLNVTTMATLPTLFHGQKCACSKREKITSVLS